MSDQNYKSQHRILIKLDHNNGVIQNKNQEKSFQQAQLVKNILYLPKINPGASQISQNRLDDSFLGDPYLKINIIKVYQEKNDFQLKKNPSKHTRSIGKLKALNLTSNTNSNQSILIINSSSNSQRGNGSPTSLSQCNEESHKFRNKNIEDKLEFKNWKLQKVSQTPFPLIKRDSPQNINYQPKKNVVQNFYFPIQDTIKSNINLTKLNQKKVIKVQDQCNGWESNNSSHGFGVQDYLKRINKFQ